MEYQELAGDQTSQEESQLNPEIGREEGIGSWDNIDTEEEYEISDELEKDQDIDTGLKIDQNQEEADPEEAEQKNTLEDKSRRVLSFKDFFSGN